MMRSFRDAEDGHYQIDIPDDAPIPEWAIGMEEVAALPATESPSPAICDPWQIRKALTAMGLRQAVEGAVAASTDRSMKDGWQFAPRFRSDDPYVLAIGAALGKSEAEIYDLIALAATL